MMWRAKGRSKKCPHLKKIPAFSCERVSSKKNPQRKSRTGDKHFWVYTIHICSLFLLMKPFLTRCNLFLPAKLSWFGVKVKDIALLFFFLFLLPLINDVRRGRSHPPSVVVLFVPRSSFLLRRRRQRKSPPRHFPSSICITETNRRSPIAIGVSLEKIGAPLMGAPIFYRRKGDKQSPAY